jgi:hypothetical protein
MAPMARQSDDMVHPLLEDLREAREALLRFIKELERSVDKRFDPDGPPLLTVIILIFAIALATILVREGVQAWLAHP